MSTLFIFDLELIKAFVKRKIEFWFPDGMF